MEEEEYGLEYHLEENEGLWEALAERGSAGEAFQLEFEIAPAKETDIQSLTAALAEHDLQVSVKKIGILFIRLGRVVYATSLPRTWSLESLRAMTKNVFQVCEAHSCILVECGASLTSEAE